jgi:hypothetical protein
MYNKARDKALKIVDVKHSYSGEAADYLYKKIE